MSLSTAAKNTMLDNQGITHLSLHSAFSSIGGNELAGGSYARQAVTYSAASSGAKSLSMQPVFPVPASTVGWIGKWQSATFAGMTPNNGAEKEFFVDVSSNVITCYAHGYANGQTVVVFGDPVMPGNVTEGTTYYVISATTDTFQISTTPAGSPVDITSVPGPGAVISKITYEVYGTPATHTITSGQGNLNG